jgi:hypothetical protein
MKLIATKFKEICSINKTNRIKIILLVIGVVICINPILSYAQSNVIAFPVIDQLLCGFISYSKSKLAPYIAVLCVTLSVIGHWLGMSRLWGALLYVAMGLGLIMGIGTVITNATGASASCIAS